MIRSSPRGALGGTPEAQILGESSAGAVDNSTGLHDPRSAFRLGRRPRTHRRESDRANPASESDENGDALLHANGACAPREHHRRALPRDGAHDGMGATLRIGEASGLRRSDIDIVAGTTRVANNVVEVAGKLHEGLPKTAAARRVMRLPASLIDDLAEHLDRLRSDVRLRHS